MVIETWRKVYNGKIINIIVKHDDCKRSIGGTLVDLPIFLDN